MTGRAPSRIADYEVVGALQRPGAETYLLARPPARLGLSADTVTVTVIHGRHEAARFSRVSQELRHFAAVGSPHLVELYETGSEDGHLWYSMEHHGHGSLGDPAEPLPPDRRIQAVADAARGAHALHEAGIAHRDIRPATVLLGAVHAVLAELELARFLVPGRTVPGTAAIGDLEYIDPALIRGERADRAGDIWFLGLTLHRALAETSAYPGLTPDGGMLAAVRRVLAGAPEISPRLDRSVAAIVRACVAPDPADRPATAQALADQIEAL